MSIKSAMARTMTNSLLAVNEQVIAATSKMLPMTSESKRLKFAREQAGFDTPSDAARAMEIPLSTYLGHENGTTPITRAAKRYAAFFRVSLDWLLTGDGTSNPNAKVAVVAYIGAGAELYPVDDHPKGRGLERVPRPPGVGGDVVAAKIKGDSMHPFRDGWIVFWQKNQDGVPEECLGQLCVCQVRNGPTLLKELHRGSRRGLFTLISWNAPPKVDVDIEWAAKVVDIRQP